MRHIRFLSGGVSLILMLSGLASAQTGNSVITGSVTDASGGAIPGVDITLINPATGTRAVTISNETGVYRFASLPPAIYQVEASLPGFERLSRGPLTLQVSQTLGIDLMLQVGKV